MSSYLVTDNMTCGGHEESGMSSICDVTIIVQDIESEKKLHILFLNVRQFYIHGLYLCLYQVLTLIIFSWSKNNIENPDLDMDFNPWIIWYI